MSGNRCNTPPLVPLTAAPSPESLQTAVQTTPPSPWRLDHNALRLTFDSCHRYSMAKCLPELDRP